MIDVEKLRRTAAKSKVKELRKQRKLRRKKAKREYRKIERIIKKRSREGKYDVDISSFDFYNFNGLPICAIRLFRLKNKSIKVDIHSSKDPWFAVLAWGEDVACDDNK